MCGLCPLQGDQPGGMLVRQDHLQAAHRSRMPAVPADQMSLAACTSCILPRSCSLRGGALTLPPPCHSTFCTPSFHACDCRCLPLACRVLACGAPTRPAQSGTLPRNGTSATLPSELRRCPNADGWVHCVGLPTPDTFSLPASLSGTGANLFSEKGWKLWKKGFSMFGVAGGRLSGPRAGLYLCFFGCAR